MSELQATYTTENPTHRGERCTSCGRVAWYRPQHLSAGWYCGDCGHEHGQPAPPVDAGEDHWEQTCGQPYQLRVLTLEREKFALREACARWERAWWAERAARRVAENEVGRLRAAQARREQTEEEA